MAYKFGICYYRTVIRTGQDDDLVEGRYYTVHKDSADFNSHVAGDSFICTQDDITTFMSSSLNKVTEKLNYGDGRSPPSANLKVRLIPVDGNWDGFSYELSDESHPGYFENTAVNAGNYELWDNSSGSGQNTGKIISVGEKIVA